MPQINWGQAAGEALLIVVGVLLALGADAWWEARSERRQEQEYLQALLVELGQMREHVESVRNVAVDVEDAGRALHGISANWASSPVPSDSLADLIVTISVDGEWSPPRSVYDDLINTGAVSLIQSDDVRRALNELVVVLDWVETRQIRHNAFFWTEMEPYFRRSFPTLAVFGWGSMQPTGPWTPGPFVESQDFRNLVAAKSLTALDVRDGAEALLDLIEEVTATVRRHTATF